MNDHSDNAAASSLSFALLRLLLYFETFSHPLTVQECARFLRPDQDKAVSKTLAELIGSGLLLREGDLVGRPGRVDFDARRTDGERAEQVWPWARRAAAILARIPFVEGVLITGALSKGRHAHDGDVDFFLIVEPGRVWLVKSWLQLLRKLMPHPVRELFCTNYIRASDSLALETRNVFIAIELATAIPMYGPEACEILLRQNAWSAAYVPGIDWCVRRARNARPLPPKLRWTRRVIDPFASVLDPALMRIWGRFWDRKYSHLGKQTREKRFMRAPHVATNHLEDTLPRAVKEWQARMIEAGIPFPSDGSL